MSVVRAQITPQDVNPKPRATREGALATLAKFNGSLEREGSHIFASSNTELRAIGTGTVQQDARRTKRARVMEKDNNYMAPPPMSLKDTREHEAFKALMYSRRESAAAGAPAGNALGPGEAPPCLVAWDNVVAAGGVDYGNCDINAQNGGVGRNNVPGMLASNSHTRFLQALGMIHDPGGIGNLRAHARIRGFKGYSESCRTRPSSFVEYAHSSAQATAASYAMGMISSAYRVVETVAKGGGGGYRSHQGPVIGGVAATDNDRAADAWLQNNHKEIHDWLLQYTKTDNRRNIRSFQNLNVPLEYGPPPLYQDARASLYLTDDGTDGSNGGVAMIPRARNPGGQISTVMGQSDGNPDLQHTGRVNGALRFYSFAEYLDVELGENAHHFEKFLREWPSAGVDVLDGVTPNDGRSGARGISPALAFTYVSGIMRGIPTAVQSGPACHCPNKTHELANLMADGAVSLQSWQDQAILDLDAAVAAVAGVAGMPQAEQDKYFNASDAVKRNIVMALCYSRSNDELHCQSLFGDSNTDGVRAMELRGCEFKFDRRYSADMHGTRVAGDVSTPNLHATWSTSGILRSDVVGAGAHFLFATDDTEAEVADAYTRYQEHAEVERIGVNLNQYVTAQDRLYIAANGPVISVPVLVKGDEMVIDMRPGMVIQGIYYYDYSDKARYYATTNDLYDQLDLDHISDGLDVRMYGTILADGAEGVRYRRIEAEPEFNLRLRNVNNNDANTGAIRGHPLLNIDGAGASGRLFDAARHSLHNLAPGDRGGGDGTPGSFDQLKHRYGARDQKSILGIPLPVTVIDKQYHVSKKTKHTWNFGGNDPDGQPITAANGTTYRTMGFIATGARGCADIVGTWDQQDQFWRLSDNLLGYGDYVPLPYDRIKADGTLEQVQPDSAAAAARVAPLVQGASIAHQQRLVGARAPPPSADALASSMARPHMHNEIGIAMQAIEPGRQGDVMLFDGI